MPFGENKHQSILGIASRCEYRTSFGTVVVYPTVVRFVPCTSDVVERRTMTVGSSCVG